MNVSVYLEYQKDGNKEGVFAALDGVIGKDLKQI